MLDMRENERITQGTYDLVAKDWAREHNNTEYWLEEFKTFSRMLPRGKILDIGCGWGKDYALFRDAGYDYTGLDFSGAFLAEMRERFSDAKCVQANMRSIPFKENSFDGFWAAASLLHIEKKDIKEVLHGIRQIVRPDGIGFISLKEGEGERLVQESRGNWSADDIRFFSFYHEFEFADILLDCGILPVIIRKRARKGDPAWLEFFVKCIKV